MDVVTQQGDQSLRAWWQVVAHFNFSLRCESHLNCLTDTRHGVNFSWQPAFFFYKVIELCTRALQRWCVFRHIRISSRFTPVKIHPQRFAGSQTHTVVQIFLRLHKYVYISTINISICSQSCVWTSARYTEAWLKISRHWIEEKQSTPTPGTALQQWLHCQTSTYTISMENSISLLCSFQS